MVFKVTNHSVRMVAIFKASPAKRKYHPNQQRRNLCNKTRKNGLCMRRVGIMRTPKYLGSNHLLVALSYTRRLKML